MADKTNFKMLFAVFSFFLVINPSYSLPNGSKWRDCNCYELCDNIFNAEGEKNADQLESCKRGCRIYSLVFHVTHKDNNSSRNITLAKNGCINACTQGYATPENLFACKFGCDVDKYGKDICKAYKNDPPQNGYSAEEPESPISADPDPDDPLTDQGLRKQFEKKMHELVDYKEKIPETHFRNYPLNGDRFMRTGINCAKFYGLDSKLEFRNGKMIVGDLYLFAGVFIFVIVCFILAHHMDAVSVVKQVMDEAVLKKEEMSDKEHLLKIKIKGGGELKRTEIYSDIPKKTKPKEAIAVIFTDECSTKKKPIKENDPNV